MCFCLISFINGCLWFLEMIFESKCIEYETKNKVGYITLNRPVVNAFSVPMVEKLAMVLDYAEKDYGVKVVVLSGSGRYFSTGMDLKEVDVFNVELVSEIQRFKFNPVAAKLYYFSKPLICELNGVAAGAGLGFALGCDLLYSYYADEKNCGKLVFDTINKGLLFACGGSYLLVEKGERMRAQEILFFGETLDAKRGLEEKLVRGVYSSKEELHEQVILKAEDLAAKSGSVLSGIKQALRAGSSRDDCKFETYLEREVGLQMKCLESEEFQEAMKMFRKR